MVSNVLGSPRTTFAGAAGITVGGIGEHIVPQLAAYFGAQPSPLWQLLGMALGLIVPALMKDVRAKLEAASKPSPTAGIPPATIALLVGGALLVAAPARAQTPASSPAVEPVVLPIPAAGVCFDAKNAVCLRPLVGFTGTAYDFTHHSVVRSFQISGLYELTLPGALHGKLGIAGGGGFQGGDVVGVAATGGVTLPLNLAILASGVLAGTKASVTATIGTVVRFP